MNTKNNNDVKSKIINLLVMIMVALSFLDIMTTLYGFRLGLEEENPIAIIFIKILGNTIGVIISNIAKLILIFIAYIIYQSVNRNMDKIKHRSLIYILNIFLILSFTVPIIITSIIIYQNVMMILGVLQQ